MDAVREAARKRLEEGEVGLEFASITEQLEAVISYLKNLPGRPAVLPEVLAESLKLPILESIDLLSRLRSNPRIEILDGKYRFKPEIEFRDKDDLLDHLSREPCGYPVAAIRDAYIGCERDIEELRDRGYVIYMKSLDRANYSDVIFRRQTGILLELPFEVEPAPGNTIVVTRGDLRQDVHRGDLLYISGEPYRVSRAVRMSGSRVDRNYGSKHKKNNAGGDYSVAAVAPHVLGGQSYTYELPFTATELPLDRPYLGEAKVTEDGRPAGVKASRMGCSARLRELWRASIGEDKDNKFSFFNTTKFPESHEALREVMKKAGLPSTPAPDAMPHDKKFKKPDSKKRRLGAMKPIKSNVHMAGTAEGAAIQRIREETHKKLLAAHHQQQSYGRR